MGQKPVHYFDVHSCPGAPVVEVEFEPSGVSFGLPGLQASRQVCDMSGMCFNPDFYNTLQYVFSSIIAMMHANSARPVALTLSQVCCRSCKCSHATFMEQAKRHGTYTEETLQFMQKILSTSGLGDETYMPASAIHCLHFPACQMHDHWQDISSA